jgi:phospholipid/cholesterol/gamma-HCH transport system substrate-binding protein
VLNFNSLPIPVNPFIQKSVDPANVEYSEPRLAPGGAGPKPGPPETPPAISAYTGLNGDSIVPGPAPSVPLPRIPGAAMPEPPPPSTVEPAPPAPSLPGMLLPAEAGHP